MKNYFECYTRFKMYFIFATDVKKCENITDDGTPMYSQCQLETLSRRFLVYGIIGGLIALLTLVLFCYIRCKKPVRPPNNDKQVHGLNEEEKDEEVKMLNTE